MRASGDEEIRNPFALAASGFLVQAPFAAEEEKPVRTEWPSDKRVPYSVDFVL